MNDPGWLALAAALTVAGSTWTWWALRNRGSAAAMRAAGFTALAPAAFLTGTLEMFGEIGAAVGDWATGFVFSPAVWIGVVLAGLGVTLVVVSGWLAGRGEAPAAVAPAASGTSKRQLKSAPVDDDLADIEAILKNRGIT